MVESLAVSAMASAPVTPIDVLPPPVQAYFHRALPPNPRRIRSAVATQEAEFFINGAWRLLTATQYFRASPPAFVWDARIQMAPLIPALVRDSFVDGRGAMQASVYGVYTIVNEANRPELNAGALQRFLGEAIWIPTALLPSDSVSWTARNDRSAIATVRDADVSASLLFEFDDTGLVRRISGDRYQEQQGTYVLTPWLIECSEPRARDGILIPTRCEVAWNNGGTIEPYWRGRITDIQYRFD